MVRQHKHRFFTFGLALVLSVTTILGTTAPVWAVNTSPSAGASGGNAAPLSSVNMLEKGLNFANRTSSDSNLPLVSCQARFIHQTANPSNLMGETGLSSSDLTALIAQSQATSTLPAGFTSLISDTAGASDFSGGDNLTLANLQYMSAHVGQEVPTLKFSATPGGQYSSNAATQCADFSLFPVSASEWRGRGDIMQANGGTAEEYYVQFNLPNPNVVSAVSTGTLHYWTRNTGSASWTPATANSFVVGSNPTAGDPGTSAGGNTVSAIVEGPDEIVLTSGSGAQEVYTKSSWDNNDYYFLSDLSNASKSDQAARSGLTASGGAANCATPLDTSGNCQLTGGSNCVPFFYITNDDFSFKNNYKSSTGNTAPIGGLQSAINNLEQPGLKIKYYDYNDDSSCSINGSNTGANVTIDATGPNIWFYYSKKNDAFVSVFNSGAGNETNWVGDNTEYNNAGGSSNTYVGGTGNCAGKITPKEPGITSTSFQVIWQFWSNDCQTEYGTVTVWATADESKFSNIVTANNAKAAVVQTTNPSLNCHAGINPLNWLLCGAVYGMVGIVNQLDNEINSLLSVGTPGNSDNPTGIFGAGSTAQSYKSAWNAVRVIALGLLAVAGLIVIIAQALGFEILDAYTIRKVLPRLLIVAVAITLSWPLMDFMVTLSNDLGYGVRWLIYQPFHSLSGGKIDLNLGGGGGLAVDLIGAGAIASMGIFGLLSFAVTAALAVSVAFLTLIIRQLVIVMLIIFAPVAIVSYVLPNTQKMYKIWWDSFGGALLMFPLISAFIAAGRVFSAVSSAQSGAINELIGFAAYFAPYFMIPLTFRFAGGALRGIGGFVNDKHRGAFDGLKNFRANQTKQRRANAINRAKTGNIFKGADEASMRGRINSRIQDATLLKQAGLGVNPLKYKDRIAGARSLQKSHEVEEAEKNSVALRTIGAVDDDIQAALAGDETAQRAHYQGLGLKGPEIESRMAMIRQAKREVGESAFMDYVVAQNAATGTGYKDGPAEMLAAINRVAGGDRSRAGRLIARARSNAERARRVDLYGAGFAKTADQAQQLWSGQANADSVNEVLTDEVLLTKSPGEIASGRNNSLVNLQGAIVRRVARANLEVTQAQNAMDPTKIDPTTGKAGARTAKNIQRLAAAEADEKRVMAATSGLHAVAGQVSTENAEAIGAVMGNYTTGRMIHDPTKDKYELQRVVRHDETGREMRVTDRTSPDYDQPLYETIRVKVANGVKAETLGDRIEDLEGDPVYKQYIKTYTSDRAATQAQNASNAARQGSITGPPAIPGAPPPPTATP